MRISVNINGLPDPCDVNGLELINMHWQPHTKAWRMHAPATYVREAFSNGVSGARSDHDGPLCLDLEPVELAYGKGAEFQRALNIHESARQRVRGVFPGRELWACCVAAGRDELDATARVCACRAALDGLDAAGTFMYFEADGSYDEAYRSANMRVYVRASELCWPHFEPVAFVSPHCGATNRLQTPGELERVIERVAALGVRSVSLWHSNFLAGSLEPQAWTDALQPYLDVMRTFASRTEKVS